MAVLFNSSYSGLSGKIKRKGYGDILQGEKEVFQKEGGMFEVSEKATEMLKEYFKDREKVPSLRIYLAPGG